jgi:hypothetical protein
VGKKVNLAIGNFKFKYIKPHSPSQQQAWNLLAYLFILWQRRASRWKGKQ